MKPENQSAFQLERVFIQFSSSRLRFCTRGSVTEVLILDRLFEARVNYFTFECRMARET